MDAVAFTFDPGLDVLRRRRAELFESMGALRQALAAPTSGCLDAWSEWVDVALVELSADVRAHIAITEGPGGLHTDVMDVAPRLSHAVQRLVREHVVIVDLLDGLTRRARSADTLARVEDVRCLGGALLGRLDRHRRRGADLVFEAYETDLGGDG
ncbi:MAG TPA: hypothetical protein VH373_11930 [Jatrophihabitantaceae bacterium]|jgi:hypothetical protein